MSIYSTTLHIKNKAVKYEVSWQQENKLLLYKPQLTGDSKSGVPMFYVIKQNGAWLPVNIKDKTIIEQVAKDISAHHID